MKIQNYSVQQDSLHRVNTSRDATERLTVYTDGTMSADDEASYFVEINQPDYEHSASKTGKACNDSAEECQDQKTETKLRLIEALVYQMTGKRIKLQVKMPQLDSSGEDLPMSKGLSPVQARDGWGLIYEYQETVAESESIQFNSGGTVTTSQGKTISFSLEFNMSRSYYQQKSVSIRMGDATKVDPLVVVMNGGTPALSRNRVDFDLNSDGSLDKIAFATGGSDFLALDRNEDGDINDGSDLFGSHNGNGFAELRAFDLDHNGWIDESDEVFGRLSILTLSESGEKTLVKLADAGIGAIYLQEVSAPFDIRDTEDEFGQIRSSSFYLRENGTAGSIQHIDLSL